MSEFFFRGTIPELWKLIYAEYKLLSSSHGAQTFIFFEPNPKTQPLDQYRPGESDTIMFAFMGANGEQAISVDVEFQPDRELVQVMSFYQTAREAITDSLWKRVLSSLEKDSRWIDPAQHLGKPSKRSLPKKPKHNSPISDWFDYYHSLRALNYHYTLKEIAQETGYSVGYTGQLHANYVKAREISRPKRPKKNLR